MGVERRQREESLVTMQLLHHVSQQLERVIAEIGYCDAATREVSALRHDQLCNTVGEGPQAEGEHERIVDVFAQAAIANSRLEDRDYRAYHLISREVARSLVGARLQTHGV
jgi:hypothetical protein